MVISISPFFGGSKGTSTGDGMWERMRLHRRADARAAISMAPRKIHMNITDMLEPSRQGFLHGPARGDEAAGLLEELSSLARPQTPPLPVSH